jgi:hypothetical protein
MADPAVSIVERRPKSTPAYHVFRDNGEDAFTQLTTEPVSAKTKRDAIRAITDENGTYLVVRASAMDVLTREVKPTVIDTWA